MRYQTILSISVLILVLFAGSSMLISTITTEYNKYTETQLEVRKWLHEISQPPKPENLEICHECKVIQEVEEILENEFNFQDKAFKHYEEGANIMPEDYVPGDYSLPRDAEITEAE